jgi:uncharacterized membrane protein
LAKSTATAQGVRIQRPGATRRTTLSNIATAISPAAGSGEWVPENLRDPAFDRYVDLALLCKAWDEKNASVLADVALQFREGERVLLRPHRGFSSQQLLGEAARIAVETKQAEALQRLRKIAETISSAELKAKLAGAEKLAGPARGTDPALQVSIAEMRPEVFAELWQYLHAIQDAGLAGDTAALKRIEDKLANNTRIPEKQKKYLKKVLLDHQATAAAVPEAQKQLDQALDKLSDSSRRGPTGGGHAGGGGGHAGVSHTPSGRTFAANTFSNKNLGNKNLGNKNLGNKNLGNKNLTNKNLSNKNLTNKDHGGNDRGRPGRFPTHPIGGGVVGVASTGTVPVGGPVAVVTTTVPGTTATDSTGDLPSGPGMPPPPGGWTPPPPPTNPPDNGDPNNSDNPNNPSNPGNPYIPPGQIGSLPPGCSPNPTCPPDHHHHHHRRWYDYGWYFVDGQWVFFNCNCGCGDVAVADTAVYGGLWFENLQDEEVTVAIVYYDTNTPTWMVTGWYVVEPGERVCVMNGDVSNQTFYYYAFSTDWQWEGDDGNYYVNPDDAFSYDSQDPAAVSDAEQAGYENHGFTEIDVGDTPYFLQKLQ